MNLLVGVKNAVKDAARRVAPLSLRKKIILLLAVLIAIWFGIRPLISSQKGKISYQTAEVEKGTLISSVAASGTVSSAGSASITTSATGVISQLYVQNGDTVAKGDKIADITLDANSQQRQAAAYASYLAAQNSVNTEKAQINSLQSALFRANQAFMTDKGIADPDTDDPTYIQERADWLQAEADYNNQQTAIQQSEAALASASLSYQQTSPTMTAPIAGIVTNLTLTLGQVISNSSSSSDSSNNNPGSQTFGTISLPDAKPQAIINLSEIDVTKVAVDQKATLTLDAFPDKTFTGKVSSINTSGTASSGVTSYPVTITFDTAPKNMYQNMAVNATIITDVQNNVLMVPSAAVQTANGESIVRVLKNGKPEAIPVELGSANDTEVEVLSGISAGDTVIIGQTGGQVGGASGPQSASPFGGGFGGRNAGFGGGAVRIQRGSGG